MIVIEIMGEGHDVISVTARETVIVTDSVVVTGMKVDLDRSLLDDTSQGQETKPMM